MRASCSSTAARTSGSSSAGVRIESRVHYLENRPIFDSSAFSIFFIGRMDAIAPLYGDKSRGFARVRDAFSLAPDDILLPSLIGARS